MPVGPSVRRREPLLVQWSSLCLTLDGRLASGSDDHTIRLWDVAHLTLTSCLEGHAGPVAALCLLADGRLASCSHDHTVRLFNVRPRRGPCFVASKKARPSSKTRAGGFPTILFRRLFHLSLHRLDFLLDLGLDRFEIEARAALHRRVFDERLGVFADLLLQEHEAPELVLVEVDKFE